jgi:hypothetical protein
MRLWRARVRCRLWWALEVHESACQRVSEANAHEATHAAVDRSLILDLPGSHFDSQLCAVAISKLRRSSRICMATIRIVHGGRRTGLVHCRRSLLVALGSLSEVQRALQCIPHSELCSQAVRALSFRRLKDWGGDVRTSNKTPEPTR